MGTAPFKALPFCAYCCIPLRLLTNCIKQLTNKDTVKRNCNLPSNKILFTRPYMFRSERTINRPYRIKTRLYMRVVPKVMSNFFLNANWEQQTKESAVVDGTSCCVILECLVTSIAFIT